MKIKSKHIISAVLCIMLCGCSPAADTAPPEQTAQGITEQTAEQPQEKAEEKPKVTANPTVMPIISIESASGNNDFAFLPVNEYVSSQIATWTPGYVIPPAPYYEDCKITMTAVGNKVLIDEAEAQVKVRGNWTTNYYKKPLRIKFTEKQSIEGLGDGVAYKNWVLLAEYKDASMLRNKTALEISRDILGKDGLYAADAQFVEVMLNGKYWGVYLLTELQQVNEGRIEITDTPQDYTGTDTGYLLEFDGNFFLEEPLQQFHVDYCDNAELKPFDGNGGSGRTVRCLPASKGDPKKDIGFTIKSDIYSEEQHDFIADYVNNVYRIMYEAAYNDKAFVFGDDYSAITETADITPEEAVRLTVDVDSLADMYIISELTCDADLYWSSFFMTADFGSEGNKKLTFQAPWDYDSALGNKSRCPDGRGFYAANIIPDVNGDTYETINPWLAVLSFEDWYQDIIREKWTAAYDGAVFEKALEGINTDREQLREAFNRNNDRWGISTRDPAVQGELSEKAMSCPSQDKAAIYLHEWLTERVSFMNEYWHK